MTTTRKTDKRGATASAEAARIDALYGLEPVYEAGSDPRLVSLSDTPEVSCPWCAESSSVQVDLADAGQVLVQDCQVCCRPMELRPTLDRRSRLQVEARRAE